MLSRQLYAIPRQAKNSSTTTLVDMIFHDPCGDRVAQGPAFLEQEDRIMELRWRVLNNKQNNGRQMACLEQISAKALSAMNEMTTKRGSKKITGARTILSPTLTDHQGRSPNNQLQP